MSQTGEGSGVLIRTKTRYRGGKHHKPSHAQPLFNDPLYEHLDNEVQNKEQHNFGPWVEMDRKSR